VDKYKCPVFSRGTPDVSAELAKEFAMKISQGNFLFLGE